MQENLLEEWKFYQYFSACYPPRSCILRKFVDSDGNIQTGFFEITMPLELVVSGNLFITKSRLVLRLNKRFSIS